jgi:hypothetical protein
VPVTLGNVTFDEKHTSVEERLDEVGGRDERAIEITGILIGASSVAAVNSELDAVLAASSARDFAAALSIRPGRRLWVRRERFVRDVSEEKLVGSFKLGLRAKDPFEESTSVTTAVWPVSSSDTTKTMNSAGNTFAKPIIMLVATGTVVDPTFSDGIRTMGYSGTVGDGSTLVFDAAAGTVTLNGADVTPYVMGEFPRVDPEGTTLTYSDHASSSHTASVVVAYRDRWW